MNPANLSYLDMLKLQRDLNETLRARYQAEAGKGRDHLAKELIPLVEGLVSGLNEQGHTFGHLEYGGDSRFEYSEQIFSNGKQPGEGVILHFLGFSVQVSWGGDGDVA